MQPGNVDPIPAAGVALENLGRGVGYAQTPSPENSARVPGRCAWPGWVGSRFTFRLPPPSVAVRNEPRRARGGSANDDDPAGGDHPVALPVASDPDPLAVAVDPPVPLDPVVVRARTYGAPHDPDRCGSDGDAHRHPGARPAHPRPCRRVLARRPQGPPAALHQPGLQSGCGSLRLRVLSSPTCPWREPFRGSPNFLKGAWAARNGSTSQIP